MRKMSCWISKSHKFDNTKIRSPYIGLMYIGLCICLLGVLSGCTSLQSKSNVEEQQHSLDIAGEEKTNIEDSATSDEVSEEHLPILYSYNEDINKLMNSYNEVNPDNKIVEGEFSPYEHHGGTHEDQAISYRNGYETVVSDTAGLDVFLQPQDSSYYALDAVKLESCKWIRAMYPDATNEDIDNIWQLMLDEGFNVYVGEGALEGLELQPYFDLDHKQIEYIKIYKHRIYRTLKK